MMRDENPYAPLLVEANDHSPIFRLIGRVVGWFAPCWFLWFFYIQIDPYWDDNGARELIPWKARLILPIGPSALTAVLLWALTFIGKTILRQRNTGT